MDQLCPRLEDFDDIECSCRSIRIQDGKGGVTRLVYMDRYTFAALNKYLDEERQSLFPDVDEIFIAFKGKARGRPWSDEDILAAYEGKTKNTEYRYSVFLSFLFYRGYHRPNMHLLMSLPLWLHRQWRLAVAPYQKRLEHVTTEPGYFVPWKKGGGYVLELFLGLLVFTGKTLEELTRGDFEGFRAEYLTWYAQNGQGKKDHPDPRLFRLERYLVHWGIIPALKRVAPRKNA